MNSQALKGIDTHSRTESSASWHNDGASEAEREAETGRVAVKSKRVEAERHVSMRATQANEPTGEQSEGQLEREPGRKRPQGEQPKGKRTNAKESRPRTKPKSRQTRQKTDRRQKSAQNGSYKD